MADQKKVSHNKQDEERKEDRRSLHRTTLSWNRNLNITLSTIIPLDLLGNIQRRREVVGRFGVMLANESVLGYFIALAFDQAIRDDGEDPEHSQENTNTAAKDKGHSTTLPRT